MPWGLFTLALLVTYVLQTAALARFAPEWLDLLLVLALICGLTAPAIEARLAGWLVGFAQDVGSSGPLGLHALALGLAVFALTQFREMINRELWWVRWLAGFIVAWPAQLIIALHERYWQGVSTSLAALLGQSLATALAASFLAALLLALRALLGRRRRYSYVRW